MIIYICNDLRAVGMAHEQSSPYFVLDEENNCMVTTYQIRDIYMKIGDSHAGRHNLIKDFSDFHYSGDLISSTSGFYHKGYVELNNDNMKYFEPYVDLKNYTQIREGDVHMYSNVKNLTLCNEDFYPNGRYLILKDQLNKGKSLIGYLYDFYCYYLRSNRLHPVINTEILNAIINYEPDNQALNGYDTSIFDDKEKWQSLVSISIKIKNNLSVAEKCEEMVNRAMNAYSGDLEDLYFSENE